MSVNVCPVSVTLTSPVHVGYQSATALLPQHMYDSYAPGSIFGEMLTGLLFG